MAFSVNPFLAAAAVSLLSGPAFATVACTVLPGANLYAAPDDGAEILRAVPVNDLVLYPQQELAPEQVEGWAWVRHDPEQENIWQGGDRGWMQLVYMTTCG